MPAKSLATIHLEDAAHSISKPLPLALSAIQAALHPTALHQPDQRERLVSYPRNSGGSTTDYVKAMQRG